jgi:hypothetical protein
MIITAAIKDKVLLYLCENCTPERASSAATTILKEIDIDFDTFNAIMHQFQRIGIIKELTIRKPYCFFILLTEAHDYASRGGFTAQEELIVGNVEKLILEVEHLKKQLLPDHLDSINKIAGISSALLSALSLIKK